MQIGIFDYICTVVKLKLNSVKFHCKVFGNGFYINNLGNIFLGKRVYLNSFPDGSSYRTGLSTYFPEAEIRIGNNCYLNGTIIHCNEKITIGNNCMFGPGTVICDNDSHKVVINYMDRISGAVSKPIIIENNVWVGMNCLILKGVILGSNSIIAAGSLVTKDVLPDSLYGGHPAVFIKKLI